MKMSRDSYKLQAIYTGQYKGKDASPGFFFSQKGKGLTNMDNFSRVVRAEKVVFGLETEGVVTASASAGGSAEVALGPSKRQLARRRTGLGTRRAGPEAAARPRASRGENGMRARTRKYALTQQVDALHRCETVEKQNDPQ